MSSPEGSVDPYAAVIADLERQIVQLQAAIAAIQAVRAGTVIPSPISKANPTAASGQVNSQEIAIDAFHTLTVSQAIKKYLGMRPRRPVSTSEIVEALRAGGQAGSDGTNFAVVVNNSLNRMSAEDGAVSKVKRGIWGLKEWYETKPKSE
jgi:hypothetical protein